MFKTERAYKAFDGELALFVRNSISLVASAAVCYFAAAESEVASGDVTKELTGLIEARGLRVAQTYKYLGLARQLIADLRDAEEPDPILAKLLAAKAPSVAHGQLVAWMVKEKITSLDALSARLGGIYARGRSLAASGANQGSRAGQSAGAGAQAGVTAKQGTALEAPETKADMLKLQRELAASITDPELVGDVIGIWEARLGALQQGKKRRSTVAKSKAHDGRRSRQHAPEAEQHVGVHG